MPTRIPPAVPNLRDPAQQAAYVEDAWASGDPYLVALALKEIGVARRVPVALDENPPLSELMRAMGDLGLEVRVVVASADERRRTDPT